MQRIVRRRGFTLVELLVAIGIIAVLTSIAVPTFTRCRSQASRVKCENNLRQILQACVTYENNWNFSCPWPNWHGPELAGYRPPGWLYQYPQGTSSTASPKDVQSGSIYDYLNNIDVFHCPDDTGPWTAGPTQNLSSYLMNGATCGYGKKLPTYQSTQFQPDAIMFWEASVSGPAWNAGAVYPSQGITNHHAGGGSIGCFDGHVEWMSTADFASEEMKLPGRLWCNPGTAGGN